MRPTGQLHIGNYFGAITQFLDLQSKSGECFFFVADYHALTEATGPTEIASLSIEVAKNYIACGVDPAKCTLYRQSDVPELFTMAVLLGNIVNVGALRRCTTFKDKIAKKIATTSAENLDDLGMLNRELSVEGTLSYGLLGYPVLMAVDIIGVRANKVPVGDDQRQHVELARDFAQRFNNMFKADVFTIPEMNLREAIRVPGIDGSAKMGKSDNNTIALLESPESILKKMKRVPTQSEWTEEMAPGTKALYEIAKYACPPDIYQKYVEKWNAREEKFFGGMKQEVADCIIELIRPIQERYAELTDEQVVRGLKAGAERARAEAASVLAAMRSAMGV